jgi:hypothetical protein
MKPEQNPPDAAAIDNGDRAGKGGVMFTMVLVGAYLVLGCFFYSLIKAGHEGDRMAKRLLGRPTGRFTGRLAPAAG